MLRKILTEPDPILRKKCEPLEKVDTDTKKLMDDMTIIGSIYRIKMNMSKIKNTSRIILING